MNRTTLERGTFFIVVATVSLAFAWIIAPFFGSIFWALVLAIVLGPVYRSILKRFSKRPTTVSLATVLICVVGVIAPLSLLAVALVREAALLYQSLVSQQLDLGANVDRLVHASPPWLIKLLAFFGLRDVAGLQEVLSSSALEASHFLAAHAVNFGQNAMDLVLKLALVLYLLFFFLRDGAALVRRIEHALPLGSDRKHELFIKLAAVIRATVKGTIVIALAQGVMGAVALTLLDVPSALLWGALMALLSLVPVVGAALVWGPIALYFLFSGAIVKGVALVVFGVVVVGLVDNFLRPMLVGKDTKMPDYLVLISTLGGIALLGFNGLVIGPVLAALFVATWEQFTAAEDALET